MREICSYRFLPEKEPRLCRAKVELEPSSLVEGAYQLKKLQWTGDSVVIGGGDAPPLLHTGYFDSHLHTFWLGDTSKRVLGSEFESAEAYLKACAQRLDPFCLSYSFDEERWGVSLGDFQKKAEEILGNEYPWLLYRVCGHRALLGGPWVSRLFPGQNEVRSIFLDDHTLNLLEEISELDQDELKEDFLVAQDCLLSQGVTAVGDMSLEASMVQALHDLVAENKICFDYQGVLIDGLDTADMEPFSKTIQTPLGERRFEIFHWKRYLDGSFGAQSAHLLEPYMGSESVGQQLHEDEELFDAAKNALAKGFALSFHAIGDAAIEQVLRLSAVLKDELQEANRRFGYRAHRIEHAQLVNAEQIKRFKEEYPFWSIPLQPLHEREDLRFVKRFIGAERFEKNAYRLQSLEDAGFPISIGTDAPVVSSDPVETIRACQELKTLSERWPIDKVISYYIWKGRRNHALPDREIHEGSLVYLKEL